jgi:DNA-binding XRE family transcriptional regulator
LIEVAANLVLANSRSSIDDIAQSSLLVHIANAEDTPRLSPAQCRSARALLNWSQEDLVARSGVSKKTIADLERGATQPRALTLAQIAQAFKVAGIEFLNGKRPGVRIS